MGSAAPVAPVCSAQSARKALDAALNLVPFIDLLSCCVSFLLITAVWAQLGAVPVGSHGQGPSPETREADDTTRLPDLTLYLEADGYRLARSTGEQQIVPRRAGHFEEARLSQVLHEAKAALPEQSRLTIAADDSIVYEELVRAMDLALGARFPDLDVRGR